MHFSLHHFCYALPIYCCTKPQDLLVSLLTLTKLAIYKTRKKAMGRGNPGKYEAVFLLVLHAHL